MKISIVVIVVSIVSICTALNTVNREFADDERELNGREYTGSCGDNLTYIWSDNKETLRIFGSGEMENYSDSKRAPWHGSTFLKTVVFEGNVTSIGDYAFSLCNYLNNITIPNSVTSIGVYAFRNCMKLTNLTIPASVSSIAGYAFYNCRSLQSIIIPDGVTSIGDDTFYLCSSLTSITIPDGVTSIGQYAFSYCSSLTSITIPDTVTSIELSAFSDCKSLMLVFYQGSQTIVTTPSVFARVSASLTVCVSPDYEGKSFCNRTVDSTSEICSVFKELFNHCYKGGYIDGKFIQQKRKNATVEEERLSHGCVQYQCQSDTGDLLKVIQPCNEGRACYEGRCNETSGGCEVVRKAGWEPENHCYEVVCDDEWIVKKRMNATELEGRSYECIHYECNNDTGAIAWSMCNRTDELNLMCIDDKCTEDKTWMAQTVSIEIELVHGVNVKEMNSTEIIEVVKQLCQTGTNDMKVGWEANNQSGIVRIVLYNIDDIQTARNIADAIRRMDKGEGCEYGVLCETKNVHVVDRDQPISSTHQTIVSLSGTTSIHKLTMIVMIIMTNMDRFWN